MKLTAKLMRGAIFQAALISSEMGTTLELESEELLTPTDAAFGEFEIVEASEDERAGLRRAGYHLPDHIPTQPVPAIRAGSLGGKPFDA